MALLLRAEPRMTRRHRLWEAFRDELALWQSLRLSEASLGKYVILYACLIHFGWAALFICCPISTGSTPVHIIAVVFGGRYRAAVVLVVAALSALFGMRYKAKRPEIAGTGTVVALLPQQALLLMSSFAGILAVASEHYADGVVRVWPFILADQLPIILAGFLYSAVMLEIAFNEP